MSNAGGSQSGSEFGVNITTQNSQYIPGITAPSDGRFVLPWTDWSRTGGDTSQAAIRPQICDPREAAVNLACSALRDDIVGTAFGDTMQGMAGNDLLTGDGGRDLLLGRLGVDTIAGGAGDDPRTDGSGTDTFQFGKGGDHDTVTDVRDGADVIDRTTFGFASFAAAARHFTTFGADILFTAGTNTLLIQGFDLPQLTADDLIL